MFCVLFSDVRCFLLCRCVLVAAWVGARVLARALAENQTVQVLNLQMNRIGDLGAQVNPFIIILSSSIINIVIIVTVTITAHRLAFYFLAW